MPSVATTISSDCAAHNPTLEPATTPSRSEEHTSELQSQFHLVCRLLLGKKKVSNLMQGGLIRVKGDAIDAMIGLSSSERRLEAMPVTFVDEQRDSEDMDMERTDGRTAQI